MCECIDEDLGVCVSVRRTGVKEKQDGVHEVDIISPMKQMRKLRFKRGITQSGLVDKQKAHLFIKMFNLQYQSSGWLEL